MHWKSIMRKVNVQEIKEECFDIQIEDKMKAQENAAGELRVELLLAQKKLEISSIKIPL